MQGAKRGTQGSLEPPTAKGPQSQQLQTGVGARAAPGYSDRKVSVTFETWPLLGILFFPEKGAKL